MTDRIQDVLRLLRNMRPTAKEMIKIKILMAAHGKWQTRKEIRDKANMTPKKSIRFHEYIAQGLLEKQWQRVKGKNGSHQRNNYKTTKKGVEYLSKLMK